MESELWGNRTYHLQEKLKKIEQELDLLPLTIVVLGTASPIVVMGAVGVIMYVLMCAIMIAYIFSLVSTSRRIKSEIESLRLSSNPYLDVHFSSPRSDKKFMDSVEFYPTGDARDEYVANLSKAYDRYRHTCISKPK